MSETSDKYHDADTHALIGKMIAGGTLIVAVLSVEAPGRVRVVTKGANDELEVLASRSASDLIDVMAKYFPPPKRVDGWPVMRDCVGALEKVTSGARQIPGPDGEGPGDMTLVPSEAIRQATQAYMLADVFMQVHGAKRPERDPAPPSESGPIPDPPEG